MVYAFNTVYAAIIDNGELITPTPVKFVWDEKRDAWYNRKLDIEVEWIGHVSGPISYLSSRNYDEVVEWISNNS